jgi:phosphoribosylformylglycinamidine cyclo-ligase
MSLSAAVAGPERAYASRKMSEDPLTYGGAGVNYDALDAFKRACQREAASTVSLLAGHGAREAEGTRGESAYLIETAHGYLAHVEEGLGTKNLVADAVQQQTGRSLYHGIGIDTVATIVNDLITVGCLPLSIAMHAAVGDALWFADQQRAADLAEGFAEGCRRSGAAWGGGETPALSGLIEPGAIVLAGSAIGRMGRADRIMGDVEPGDAIVFLASSGVHTNGLTLCRKVAERLPDGFMTPMADGRAYGEALLEPSAIYVSFIAGCRAAGVRIKYAVHVTGHGWRKLMRLDRPLRYRIDEPGPAPEVFRFLETRGPVHQREMYATFNMGVGFAVYVAPADAERVVAVAQRAGHEAWIAGLVLDGGAEKAVEVPSLGMTFGADELQVR